MVNLHYKVPLNTVHLCQSVFNLFTTYKQNCNSQCVTRGHESLQDTKPAVQSSLNYLIVFIFNLHSIAVFIMSEYTNLPSLRERPRPQEWNKAEMHDI